MIVDLEQNTEEWKEFRRNKIGASDLPIIMGVSPYSTPLQLWRRKLGFEPEQKMHAGMAFGHQNESCVREEMQKRLGCRLDPVVMQCDELGFAIASLDGYNEEEKIAIEIKSCNAQDHEMAKEGKIPEKYIPQLIWQKFVSNCESLKYCSSHKGEIVVVDFLGEDEYATQDCIDAAMRFHECLLEYNPPDPSEKDHIKVSDDDFGKAAIAWQETKLALDVAKAQEKQARDHLIEQTDDGNCEGYGIRMTRVNQKGSVDWDLVCKKYSIKKSDLDEFRKDQIGFWKITILQDA